MLLPAASQAEITLLVPQLTTIQIQPAEVFAVRNDPFLPDLATTNDPPLRVVSTSYGGSTGAGAELCVLGLSIQSFGGIATLTLEDDSGDRETLQLTVQQGGDGVDASDCHDPAPPEEGEGYPVRVQVAEGGQVRITDEELLDVIHEPNGEAYGVVPTFVAVNPPEAGTAVIEHPGGSQLFSDIVFTADADYNGDAEILYRVTDSGDGTVQFAVAVTITGVNDPPTATGSTCPAGITGSFCTLDYDDIDTPPQNLVVTITTPPTGGTLGNVDLVNRRVFYQPRPGTDGDTFSYTVSDGGQQIASATVTVDVTDESLPPRAVIRVSRTDGTPIGESPPEGGISINGPPDSDGEPGETLRFDGSASVPGSNPSSSLVTYRWSVNDQELPQQTSTIDLDLPDGETVVVLVVEDALGRSSGGLAFVALDVGAPPVVDVDPPQIFFNGTQILTSVNVDNEDLVPGETVEFDASQSESPAENPIVDYTWSVNDTIVQSGNSPTASLALQDGANTIELTVAYSMGNTGSVTITANVTADIDLGTLSGLTPGQRSMGTAISELCPRMNDFESLTTGQTELLDRCTDILSDEDQNQQRGALKALTPEEITAQQSTGIDFSTSQLGNLTSRLVALRNGGGGGLSIAGLSVRDANGNLIPVQELAALAKHLAGGASGDDGESLAAKWGFFLNGNIVDGEKDETQNESGYDFGGWGITAGFDYRFTDSFVAGLSLGYNEAETDFAQNGGSLDSEGVSTSLYGTYFNDNWYADFIGSTGSVDYDSLRRIVYNDADGANDDTALGTTGGDLRTLGVSFGYDFTKGGWSFGPTVALTSVEIDIDGFAETGGGIGNALALRFGEQRAESRTAQGGFQFAYAVSREWGVLSPTMRVAFVKEFENEAQLINVRFVNDPFTNDPTQPSPGAITVFTDDPDEEYLRWSLGMTFVRTNGLSAFVDYESLAGLATVKAGELTFGVRFERNFK